MNLNFSAPIAIEKHSQSVHYAGVPRIVLRFAKGKTGASIKANV